MMQKLLLAIALVSLSPAVAAGPGSTATIPYKVLSAFQAAAAKVNAADGVRYTHVVVSLRSTRHDVAPEAIVLAIHSNHGVTRLSPGHDGLLRVPVSQALKDEGSYVTTNQPKGTLVLAFKPTVAAPVTSHFDLALVNAMVADFEQARAASPLFAKVYTLQPRAFELIGSGITASTSCGVAFFQVSGGIETRLANLPKRCVVSTTGDVVSAKLQFVK